MSEQSSWWVAQRILRNAVRAPFVYRRVSTLVFVVFVMPVLGVGWACYALTSGAIDRNLGSTFFDPDGAVDPVFVQHLMWISGAPETPYMVALLLAPLIAWAQGVWFQGWQGRVSLRVRWGHYGRILGAYLLAIIAAISVYAVSLLMPILLLLVLPIMCGVLFWYAPSIVASDPMQTRAHPVKLSVIIWCSVDFAIIVLLLTVPAGVFSMLSHQALMSPGSDEILSFQTFSGLSALTGCIAWVYGLFVLTAMMAEIAKRTWGSPTETFR